MKRESVFILHHTIERGDEEDSKLIGAYSTRSEALQAIARLRDKPGFRGAEDGFHIDEYVLDEDNWAEGFGAA